MLVKTLLPGYSPSSHHTTRPGQECSQQRLLVLVTDLTLTLEVGLRVKDDLTEQERREEMIKQNLTSVSSDKSLFGFCVSFCWFTSGAWL